jgi:hypothetical protein
MNDLDWKKPALFGGLIAGFFSVLPVVNLANCCFCAWALVGGAVASKMLISRTPRPVKSGEGAKVGLMAGLIAAGLYILLNIPLTLSGVGEGIRDQLLAEIAARSSDPQLQETMQKILEANANQTTMQKLIGSLVLFIPMSFVLAGFTVLGGMLGVALFEHRKDQPPSQPYPPPYPPQNPPQNPPPYPPQYP